MVKPDVVVVLVVVRRCGHNSVTTGWLSGCASRTESNADDIGRAPARRCWAWLVCSTVCGPRRRRGGDQLARYGATYVDAGRWVCDGKVITAAGVSAGIDMALGLVQVYGPGRRG